MSRATALALALTLCACEPPSRPAGESGLPRARAARFMSLSASGAPTRLPAAPAPRSPGRAVAQAAAPPAPPTTAVLWASGRRQLTLVTGDGRLPLLALEGCGDAPVLVRAEGAVLGWLQSSGVEGPLRLGLDCPQPPPLELILERDGSELLRARLPGARRAWQAEAHQRAAARLARLRALRDELDDRTGRTLAGKAYVVPDGEATLFDTGSWRRDLERWRQRLRRVRADVHAAAARHDDLADPAAHRRALEACALLRGLASARSREVHARWRRSPPHRDRASAPQETRARPPHEANARLQAILTTAGGQERRKAR